MPVENIDDTLRSLLDHAKHKQSDQDKLVNTLSNYADLGKAVINTDYNWVIEQLKTLYDNDKFNTLQAKREKFKEIAKSHRNNTKTTLLDISTRPDLPGNRLLILTFYILYSENNQHQTNDSQEYFNIDLNHLFNSMTNNEIKTYWAILLPDVVNFQDLEFFITDPNQKLNSKKLKNLENVDIKARDCTNDPVASRKPSDYLVLNQTAWLWHSFFPDNANSCTRAKTISKIERYLQIDQPKLWHMLQGQFKLYQEIENYNTQVHIPRKELHKLYLGLRTGSDRFGHPIEAAGETAYTATNDFFTWFNTLPQGTQNQLKALKSNNTTLGDLFDRLNNGHCVEQISSSLWYFLQIESRYAPILDEAIVLGQNSKQQLERKIYDLAENTWQSLNLNNIQLFTDLPRPYLKETIKNIKFPSFDISESLGDLLSNFDDPDTYEIILSEHGAKIGDTGQWYNILTFLTAKQIETLAPMLTHYNVSIDTLQYLKKTLIPKQYQALIKHISIPSSWLNLDLNLSQLEILAEIVLNRFENNSGHYKPLINPTNSHITHSWSENKQNAYKAFLQSIVQLVNQQDDNQHRSANNNISSGQLTEFNNCLTDLTNVACEAFHNDEQLNKASQKLEHTEDVSQAEAKIKQARHIKDNFEKQSSQLSKLFTTRIQTLRTISQFFAISGTIIAITGLTGFAIGSFVFPPLLPAISTMITAIGIGIGAVGLSFMVAGSIGDVIRGIQRLTKPFKHIQKPQFSHSFVKTGEITSLTGVIFALGTAVASIFVPALAPLSIVGLGFALAGLVSIGGIKLNNELQKARQHNEHSHEHDHNKSKYLPSLRTSLSGFILMYSAILTMPLTSVAPPLIFGTYSLLSFGAGSALALASVTHIIINKIQELIQDHNSQKTRDYHNNAALITHLSDNWRVYKHMINQHQPDTQNQSCSNQESSQSTHYTSDESTLESPEYDQRVANVAQLQ